MTVLRDLVPTLRRARPRTAPRRRGPAVLSLLALVAPLLVLPVVTAAPAQAFGTIHLKGQRAEHERITRAALACKPGVKTHGECFEPRSMDQLAGHLSVFGAVGAPDLDHFTGVAQHCDDADYLDEPGYPQSRAQATQKLQECVDELRTQFKKGVNAAAGLFDSDGDLNGLQATLVSDCSFALSVPGRAKCEVIEGFGRALHGVQDFYSHSNWADRSDPNRPIGVTNPPGLNQTGLSPILDLAGSGPITVPDGLITGYFSFDSPGDVCEPTNTRVTHACLAKDLAAIDPTTGTATDPTMPRGQILDNEQRAVTGAIQETRHQWDVFRSSIKAKYGAELGHRMIIAITRDIPTLDLIFAVDTTGSMSSYINTVLNNGNAIVDELSGRTPSDQLSDYRIAVVDYKDVDSPPEYGCPPDYDAVTDLPFTAKRTPILSALGGVAGKVSGGCDWPEDVLSGVQLGVDFPWRSDVKKAIITLGDAPGHDPERHSGLTMASVIAAANAGGTEVVTAAATDTMSAAAASPISIYPILVGGDPDATAFMTRLAEGTGGRAFDSHDGGLTKALMDAITAIIDSAPPGDDDTTPPTVTCAATPATLWSPDNKMWPVTVAVTVTDDGSGPAGFRLVSVTSNESTDSSDIAGFDLGTADVAGQLRAARLGTGTGRVYTLTYEGRDVAGNTATCTTGVTVAHDQRH